ncbi:hypothetical protein GBF38_019538 [Nibea albiflora]|uniref:Uncharacterized protein n=1 Tax=Nibea albiflora TaxID=240163 RepID=A0ACB7F1Q3_NIBAL|nr:hypothetical protein GBF38_019538 [Nibea albiflora]
MEGEKETAEEKEEEEEEKELPHIAEATSVDYPDLPIMHWEDLSQRIAELEKQEQERRERFHNHRNLQLCFINNSDSEDEEDAGNQKVTYSLDMTADYYYYEYNNSE